MAGRGPDVQDTDFAPGLVACWMRICQKKTTVELVVIFLRMRQRSTKTFAHLDSITLTNFDADFVLGVVAGRMRICHKRKELLKWIFSLLRICQKTNC